MSSDAITASVLVLLLCVVFLLPTAWVLVSGRSHGAAKFGWFVVACCFSWLGLAAFLILTHAPDD